MNNMILICRDGMMLCKDNKLRDFTCFGSPRWTAKVYSQLGSARRKAKWIGGRVAVIPENFKVDGGGTVIETFPCPDKPGYVKYIQHRIEEYFEPEPPTTQAVPA